MTENTDEKILLDGINGGNEKALETAFKIYYPRLFGYTKRFIEDQELAKDIIQECFLHLWEKRGELKTISLAALLFSMVRNGCLNYLKHMAIVNNYNRQQTSTEESGEQLYYTDFYNDSEHELLYNELKEQVDIVISEVSERAREVFIMSRYQGLKNREIAESLDISTTAVDKHLAKVIKRLRTHFKEKYPLEIYLLAIAWILQ